MIRVDQLRPYVPPSWEDFEQACLRLRRTISLADNPTSGCRLKDIWGESIVFRDIHDLDRTIAKQQRRRVIAGLLARVAELESPTARKEL